MKNMCLAMIRAEWERGQSAAKSKKRRQDAAILDLGGGPNWVRDRWSGGVSSLGSKPRFVLRDLP